MWPSRLLDGRRRSAVPRPESFPSSNAWYTRCMSVAATISKSGMMSCFAHRSITSCVAVTPPMPDAARLERDPNTLPTSMAPTSPVCNPKMTCSPTRRLRSGAVPDVVVVHGNGVKEEIEASSGGAHGFGVFGVERRRGGEAFEVRQSRAWSRRTTLRSGIRSPWRSSRPSGRVRRGRRCPFLIQGQPSRRAWGRTW